MPNYIIYICYNPEQGLNSFLFPDPNQSQFCTSVCCLTKLLINQEVGYSWRKKMYTVRCPILRLISQLAWHQGRCMYVRSCGSAKLEEKLKLHATELGTRVRVRIRRRQSRVLCLTQDTTNIFERRDFFSMLWLVSRSTQTFLDGLVQASYMASW